MTKYDFESLDEFIGYVEKYFSRSRARNKGDDSFEHAETVREGDTAFLRFRVNENFDSMAVAVRIPAKDDWLAWFPNFSHHGLGELPEMLDKINNANHERNPEGHPTSEEKCRDEGLDLESIDWRGRP